MLANQMFPAALGIFMVILVESLGMSPLMWGLIFFLPKLVDALTDPLMGTSRIERSLGGVNAAPLFS